MYIINSFSLPFKFYFEYFMVRIEIIRWVDNTILKSHLIYIFTLTSKLDIFKLCERVVKMD